jgi:NADH:ubiquinone oxidoreductase subunit 6 (subunit J)
MSKGKKRNTNKRNGKNSNRKTDKNLIKEVEKKSILQVASEEKNLNLDSIKLSLINRKDRYLIALAMISVILIICKASYRMFLKDINNIYLKNSSKPYLRPEQMLGNMLSIVCIFLVIRLIAYSFSEAKTIVNYNITEENFKTINKKRKQREERADTLYESIFVFLKHYIMFTIVFVVAGIIFTQKLSIIISALYNFNFIIPSIIVLIISGMIACWFSISKIDMSSEELEKTYKRKIIIETVIVSLIVILFFAVSIIGKDITGNMNLAFRNSEVNVKLESNYVFEDLLINIQNKEFNESINLQLDNEDMYFTSNSLIKKEVTEKFSETKKKNADLEYSMNKYDYFLYYSNSIDYSEYLINGKNKVTIFITLGNSKYRIVNYVDKDNDKYTYLRESYQKELSSN